MNFSRFFVDRPIFASVLSIIIFVVGLISIPVLPVSEYPEVVPPSVAVTARYPGANPQTISETVAIPLEEAINGVDDMIYMKSVAGSDGTLSLTVTFSLGTDPNQAQVQVQNRVAQALPQLPEDVRRQGVTTDKLSPNLMMAVHLLSPDETFDATYIRNYAVLHIRDELARIPGVGQAGLFGSGNYAMRVWVDPQAAAALDITAADIVGAVREQNVQVSAGQIGAQPMPGENDFLISINARGRLQSAEEFGDVVLRTGDGGEIIRLRDVARVELASSEDALRALLNGQPAVALPIFQAPGSNSLEVSRAVRAKMHELDDHFPEGLEWEVAYDPTVFVSSSIKAVITTLLEAVLLVVLVVVLFLQTWRASLIPLLAVPVSIVGTFGILLALGFSINTLTLFGLVLAIGIVVDDAIVVVENVERNIEEGLSPRAAAHQAMREVSGPIVAISLVLCAVFVPMVFLDGVTGQFYRQFAVAIAVATVISAINSLTLSPALAAALLKPHGAAPDLPARIIDRLAGWIFRPFNRFFRRNAERYQGVVGRSLKRRGVVFAVYAAMLAGTVFMFNLVPGGFIPTQDKTYLVGSIRLPEGASLDRTEAVARQVTELALATEGVSHAAGFVGFNALEAGLSSFAVFSLGIAPGTAAIYSAAISLSFIVFALPGGLLGTQFGRRGVILTGLVGLTVLLAAAFFVIQGAITFVVVLILGGLFWALVNVNSLPLVYDFGDERQIGAFTGLYYFSSQLAAILGPTLGGVVVDVMGDQYRWMFPFSAVFMALALLVMLRVRPGKTAGKVISAA